MSAKSSIEWTDSTWNPTRGCVEVSPGCDHCYAKVFAERWRGVKGHAYEQGFDLRLVPESLDIPLRWARPQRIFVDSMSDLFQKGVPAEFICAVFGVMAAASSHTFQLLTKRPGRAIAWFDQLARDVASNEFSPPIPFILATEAMNHCVEQVDQGIDHAWPLPNVQIGVSVEDRRHGVPRIRQLREIPAAVRFLSIEPLLEDLGELDLTGISWVIVGGESGAGARPMHPAWVRSIRDQCAAARVPFFFKQWGQWIEAWVEPGGDLGAEMRRGIVQIVKPVGDSDGHFRPGDALMRRVLSKKGAGRILDGRTHDEFPEVRS